MATESDAAVSQNADEITAIIREIRERVRSQYPQGQAPGLSIPLPDLLPVLHARDAAEGKVAAIGSVNPRPPGVLNSSIQWFKRQVARALGWFVRDQIDFNRSVMVYMQANLEVLNEINRSFVSIGTRVEAAKDIGTHWVRWREEWERRLTQNEIHFLRSVADLRSAYDHRLSESQNAFQDKVRLQHDDFTLAVEKAIKDVQQRFWADLEKIRLEYERLIHNELRVLRQKADSGKLAADAPRRAESVQPPLVLDYARFSDRFRGSEEYVRNSLRFYLPYFEGKRNVLDIGCGRGEFLNLLKQAGVRARGIDLDEETVALCTARELDCEVADLFAYLPEQAEGAFDGIFASQVIEHLPPERVPEFVRLAAAKLQPGGILALETPNPECLAIFATHFYLDPTHTRPLPPSLMVFYFEEAGLGGIEVHRLAPARESLPAVDELPAGFRDAFFGGLDYAIVGRKL